MVREYRYQDSGVKHEAKPEAQPEDRLEMLESVAEPCGKGFEA